MKIIKTPIPDLLVVEPSVFNDQRGYFFEVYNQERYFNNNMQMQFVQDNESSSKYGVIRGLHFQKPPHAQSKLVRVVKGKVLDVAVDIRKDSPTFGKHVAVELSEDNKLQGEDAVIQFLQDNPEFTQELKKQILNENKTVSAGS